MPMLRASIILSMLTVSGCGIFGKSDCEVICDYYVDCLPENYEDFGLDCEWDDDEKDTRKECVEQCNDNFKKRDNSERDEVKACIRCVQDETNGECGGEDYYDAISDCDDECDDNDVEDFFADFIEDWDPDLQCDYGNSYNNYTGPGY